MPLQKSFSEQNRSRPAQRQQWQRSRSNPTPREQQSTTRPLAALSETTKNKLHSFQFDPRMVPAATNITKPAGEENVQTTDPKKPTPPVVSNPQQHKHIDRTPIRPAWQDLLGILEQPNEDNEKGDSPSERITWDTSNDSFSSASFTPLISRNRRKRARSSSPISSPAAAKTTPNVDVKKLAQELRTPHADPALELWDRFSVPGVDASPSGLTNPLLKHLMVSSSPRPASDRSFRKAISCGTAWPKRRRIERLDSEQEALSPESLQRNSKSSMVSALLESVDGEIRRSAAIEVDIEEPESPTRPRRSPQMRHVEAQDRSRHSSQSSVTVDGRVERRLWENDLARNNTVDLTESPPTPKNPSSDYGDDDFDDDTLMEIDKSIQVQEDESTLVWDEQPKQIQPLSKPTEEDEFEDLDDDIFDGAEDLVAQVEQTFASQTSPPIPPQEHRLDALPQANVKGGEEDDYGDDFGDDIDFDAVELAATQKQVQGAVLPSSSHPIHSLSQSLNPTRKVKAIQRYLITNILDNSFIDDRGREVNEKILLVQAERTKSIQTIHLRGDWYDTPASIKAYVHVIGEFEESGRCIIDNSQNMLILHPDQLISSTVVADSFSCMRRAVLQDRVKATSDSSPALVYGTVLHEIFQEALMANDWSEQFLGTVINRILEKHLEDLYVIKVSLQDARAHVLSKMPEVRSWANAFVSPYPRPDALVQGRNGDKASMCVSKLLDVEEHVWSPMYGLKGNIDATVQVTMRDVGSNGKGSVVQERVLTVPFEVKTGKNVVSNHQAQTALYNLLLSDRYDIEVAYGILYYTETSKTFRIPAVRHELRHMIMQRNQLACHVRERSVVLPPMKKSSYDCGKCYAKSTCFIYHRLADDGDGESSGMGKDKFEEVVGHLTPVHKEFFLKWEDLLTKEERESRKMRRELWTMISTEREKLGRCFSNVIIENGSAKEDHGVGAGGSGKINRFSYTFIKEKPGTGFSFLDSQLVVGEPIVVSDEQGHFALALGYVTAVKKTRISVAVDRRLHNSRIKQPGFDAQDYQVFGGIMEVGEPEDKSSFHEDAPPVRYRLDKDEFSNGMATVRNNLVQVMTDGAFGSAEIRRLVVDLVPPRFKTTPTQYSIGASSSGTLNVDQKAAVEKVMSARDYALVLGMPGTGKTTTIAHIIRALIAQGKTVLLTSYTHTAVDNILLKLKRDKIPILRLGPPVKVHPDVPSFATLAGKPMASFEDIQTAWNDSPIVATTCLGINHPVFAERTFDYCIVDEASQITLPVCLGPIRMAKTFVLVGDHNQLPPLVQNEEARQGGLDVSLFKLLSDKHPQSVVSLEHQYRMCEDIMTLSNTLIYNGRLKCGTEALKKSKLIVPAIEALKSRHFDADSYLSLSQQCAAAAAAGRGSPSKSPRKTGLRKDPPTSFCPGPETNPQGCFLHEMVRPEARVRFIDTDALLPLSREEAKGNRIVNPCEARIVSQLVEALLTAGVPADEIGVMTHYRSQLNLLKHSLRFASPAGQIEMHTADRFQGRDKSVVVLSLVRSNEAGSIGELLKDWRRINVAFTRAKTKLLVVGSRSTLLRGASHSPGVKKCEGRENEDAVRGEEMLARFVRLMEERDWVYELSQCQLDGHFFESEWAGAGSTAAPTQASAALLKGIDGVISPSKKKAAKSPKQVLGGASARRPGLMSLDSNIKKENSKGGKPEPKTARIGERALLKGKPILRDILNDMMGDGAY